MVNITKARKRSESNGNEGMFVKQLQQSQEDPYTHKFIKLMHQTLSDASQNTDTERTQYLKLVQFLSVNAGLIGKEGATSVDLSEISDDYLLKNLDSFLKIYVEFPHSSGITKLIVMTMKRSGDDIFTHLLDTHAFGMFAARNSYNTLKHLTFRKLVSFLKNSNSSYPNRFLYSSINYAIKSKYECFESLLDATEGDSYMLESGNTSNSGQDLFIDKNHAKKIHLLVQVFEMVMSLAARDCKGLDYYLKICCIFSNIDRIRSLKQLPRLFPIPDLCKKALDLLENSENDEIVEVVRSCAHLLDTELLPVVEEVIIIHFKSNFTLHTKTLECVLSTKGPNLIYSLLKKHEIPAESFVKIFKKIRNCDISFFMLIESQETVDFALRLLPAISNFFTDRHCLLKNTISKILSLIDNSTPKNIQLIAKSLSVMIDSHKHNIKNSCFFNNPITRDESTAVLRTICCFEVLSCLFGTIKSINSLESYIEAKSMLLDTCKIIISNYPSFFEDFKVHDLLKKFKEHDFNDEFTPDLKETGMLLYAQSFAECIDFLAISLQHITIDYELVIKLIACSVSEDSSIRKKSSRALIECIDMSNCGLCLSEFLIKGEYEQKTDLTIKAIVKSMFKCRKSNLTSCQNHTKDLSYRGIDLILRSIRDVVAKKRKSATEALQNLIDGGFCDQIQHQITQNLNSEDLKLLNGSIIGIQMLFNFVGDALIENNGFVNKLISLCSRSQETVRASLDTFRKILLSTENSEIKLLMMNAVIQLSTNISRKHQFYLKSVLIDIQKNNVVIPKLLRRFVKLHQKTGNSIEFRCSKRGEMELRSKKIIFESDSE